MILPTCSPLYPEPVQLARDESRCRSNKAFCDSVYGIECFFAPGKSGLCFACVEWNGIGAGGSRLVCGGSVQDLREIQPINCEDLDWVESNRHMKFIKTLYLVLYIRVKQVVLIHAWYGFGSNIVIFGQSGRPLAIIWSHYLVLSCSTFASCISVDCLAVLLSRMHIPMFSLGSQSIYCRSHAVSIMHTSYASCTINMLPFG